MINTTPLRKKLLDLAVTGKLVPKTGEWKTVKLGDVCELITSGSRDWARYYTDDPNNPVFLRMGNLSKETFDLRLDKIQHVHLPDDAEGKRTALQENDLLFSITAEIGMLGLIPMGFPTAYINQHTALLRFKEEFRDKFIPYYLLSSLAQKYYAKEKHGLKSSFRLDTLAAISLQIPSSPERIHIVSRLEELLALEKSITEDAAAIDDLIAAAKRKILVLAVSGKLVKKRGEWLNARLGDLCEYGKCISVAPDSLDDNTWVLDLEDIEKDTGRLLVRVSAKDRKSTSTKHGFKKGTLLYSKLRTYLNKVLIAPEDGCCTSEILPLVFDDRVDSAYARIVLMSPMFLDYTATCCYGVKMPRLGTNDGKRGPFPLPPLEEQRAIVAKVDELFAVLDAMKSESAN